MTTSVDELGCNYKHLVRDMDEIMAAIERMQALYRRRVLVVAPDESNPAPTQLASLQQAHRCLMATAKMEVIGSGVSLEEPKTPSPEGESDADWGAGCV